MKKLLRVLALAAAAPMSHAGVINFDDLSLTYFDAIASNYADHGLAGNGDPRVGVSYSGSNGADNHLSFWIDLNGNLLKVAFTPTDGTTAQITLTADAGWLIQSIAFDLAAWPMITLPHWPAVDILTDVFYALDGVSVDAPGTLILGMTAPHVSNFSLSNASGAQVATMRWGTDWDVAIDNINFTVIRDPNAAVPEPGTLALAALALLAATRGRARPGAYSLRV